MNKKLLTEVTICTFVVDMYSSDRLLLLFLDIIGAVELVECKSETYTYFIKFSKLKLSYKIVMTLDYCMKKLNEIKNRKIKSIVF